MTTASSPRPTSSISQVMLESMDDIVGRLVDRLEGMSDEEYRWEPVADMWSVRETPDGPQVDMNADRGIDPAPVTTIAWRLWHIASDCFAEYTKRFAGEPDAGLDARWTLHADEAIAELQSSWAGFRATLAGFDDWFTELGDGFGPWHRHCIADFAMHASNELVHHAAEIALLRDLYRAEQRKG